MCTAACTAVCIAVLRNVYCGLSCCADEDGYITFEEFMVSYARPKPILKNLLIMVINTAVIYFILQAPFLDTMIKVRAAVC